MVPLLKTLSLPERHKIADCLNRAVYDKGSVIIRQGDIGDHFYLIEAGEAEVIVDGVTKATLNRGDYFGERALLNDAPRAATIVAKTVLKVAFLDKHSFSRLLGPVWSSR